MSASRILAVPCGAAVLAAHAASTNENGFAVTRSQAVVPVPGSKAASSTT